MTDLPVLDGADWRPLSATPAEGDATHFVSRLRTVRTSCGRTALRITIVWDDGDALVVRCDECRRLWPMTRIALDDGDWADDAEHQLHRCPGCAVAPAEMSSSR